MVEEIDIVHSWLCCFKNGRKMTHINEDLGNKV